MATKGGGRINFTKLGMAVIDELTGILRDLLKNEVKPSMIAKVVKNTKSLPRLRPEQELLIKNANKAGYVDFDTTLLYYLLRNGCPKIPPPTNGWGSDPGPTDTTVGDDIERIRLIRNKVLGHIPTTSVTDSEFQSIWTDIESICQRMDSHFGSSQSYVQNIQQIEMQSVDEQLENMYINKLQTMLQSEKDTTEKLQGMEEKLTEMKTIIERTESKVDDVRSDVKGKRKYEAVSKVTMEAVPEKIAKQEKVDILLQIEYEILNDIIQSIDENSSVEFVLERFKEIEEYESSIEDKEEYQAFLDIINQFQGKVRRFAKVKDSVGFSICSNFLKLVQKMRKKKGKLNIQRSSLILVMTFQCEEDLVRYQRDFQNGTIERHLAECFLFQPLLSIFELNSTDVIMKVTDITNGDLTTEDMVTKVMAQDIMKCDLCENSPAEMHCNSCATNLCKDCVAEHVSGQTEKTHNVVVIKKKISNPIFPKCGIHKDQNCEIKCQQCDTPVCTKCLSSGGHKTHDFLDCLELSKYQKDIIKRNTAELETSTYCKYEKAIADLEKHLQNLPQIYNKLMFDVSVQGEKWHQEVDVIISRRKKEVEKMKLDDIASLNKLLEEMKNLLSTLRQAILDNKELLQTVDVAKILDSTSSSPEMWNPPPSIDVSPPTFTLLPMQGEKLNQMFGTLTAASLPRQQRFIKLRDYPKPPYVNTGYEHGLYSITCVNPDEFWVSGNDSKIKQFITESVQETVTTATGNVPHGLTVTREGDLIYTDYDDRSINKIRHGKIEKIILLKDGWIPLTICCTPSDELLISMGKLFTPSRIVRYSGSTQKQVIQFDNQEKPLFSSCRYLFIAENSDKDIICVSDYKNKTVVVVDQEGKFRFRYTGNPSSKKVEPFSPHGVIVDSMGYILIADYNNNCIHIIDQRKNFIRYIDSCQLNQPFDLSVDRNNTLYVAEHKTAKVKVIKYLT